MKKKYGLVGYPLGHSFSKGYHNERFARLDIDAEYENYELSDIAMLRDLVTSDASLCGLNVTIPYKQSVIPFLDEVDGDAEQIGAVNVICIERDENRVRMVGCNSDCIGFRISLLPLLQKHHRKALVLGTGGASRAVVVALRSLGLTVTVVSRTPQKGQLAYDEITPNILAEHTLVVNTTPLGMSPHTNACAPIPYEYLTSQHLCYDVVYNPEVTLFMQRSAQYGAMVCNGLNMLHEQADAAWKMWNNKM
ncbi:MAG: shikimate dehydrogenase [Bacteroidaceae bacterium]|nr:shikimate dehydrogenase [Bacteroidaceae bacterium]